MRLVLVQANLLAEVSHGEMGAFLAVLGRGDARYVVSCFCVRPPVNFVPKNQRAYQQRLKAKFSITMLRTTLNEDVNMSGCRKKTVIFPLLQFIKWKVQGSLENNLGKTWQINGHIFNWKIVR